MDRVCEAPGCFNKAEYSGFRDDWGTPVLKLACVSCKNKLQNPRFLYEENKPEPVLVPTARKLWEEWKAAPSTFQLVSSIVLLIMIAFILSDPLAFLGVALSVVAVGVMVLLVIGLGRNK